ncbi:MAG: ATP-binding cassette domain-containing protein [Caldicoprobacterales bacterium]
MNNTVPIKNSTLIPRAIIFRIDQVSHTELQKKCLVGRKTNQNSVDLNLNAKFVSRKHGFFDCDSAGWFYVDTSSKSGTYCNGKKLLPEQKHYLRDGDVLHIFSGIKGLEDDFVTIVFSTSCSQEYTLEKIPLTSEFSEISIGRTGKKSILMSSDAVSPNHASFFTAQSGWAIIDHNSKSGVYLNGQRIFSAKYIREGDCIKIADSYFFFTEKCLYYYKPISLPEKDSIFKNENGLLNAPLSINIIERSAWLKTKKLNLLRDIRMTIHPGEMVLILGGSGAGKTTFLNAVMGYEKAEGKIMLGETDIYEDFESVKHRIGFVPQQDLLRGSDTVYDTLENAAEMKLPSSIKRDKREARIETVLEALGLQRERDSLVSKLSGGQRKRLSIAVEYIANPSLFCLDEPDSGLDGVMAKALMENLRKIADEGKIVLVISHGPDRAAAMFDKVIVLAKSEKDNCGHLAFYGTIDEAYRFFDAASLEGVVKRINRADEGGDGLSDYYIKKYQSN